MKNLMHKRALDKTFIRKISRGFAFLGYRFNIHFAKLYKNTSKIRAAAIGATMGLMTLFSPITAATTDPTSCVMLTAINSTDGLLDNAIRVGGGPAKNKARNLTDTLFGKPTLLSSKTKYGIQKISINTKYAGKEKWAHHLKHFTFDDDPEYARYVTLTRKTSLCPGVLPLPSGYFVVVPKVVVKAKCGAKGIYIKWEEIEVGVYCPTDKEILSRLMDRKCTFLTNKPV